MLRRHFLLAGTTLLISFIMPLHSQNGTTWKDPSPHVVRFVSVDDGVRLEVQLDKPILVDQGISWTAHYDINGIDLERE